MAECQLIGVRTLPNQKEPQRTVHFTARIRLVKQPIPAPVGQTPVTRNAHGVGSAEIYRLYFHGPAYQVIEEAWWDGEKVTGLFADGLPPNHQPSELPLAVSPRLIELCFQTAGIWEMGLQGRMGLPQSVHEMSVFNSPNPPEGRLYAVVTPNRERGDFDAEILDAKGTRYLRLSGYRTVALPGGLDAEKLKNLHAALSPETAVLV